MTSKKLRELTQDEVRFSLEAHEDDTPIRGNILDSGDPEVDRKVETELILRRANGDVWAWAVVTVTAQWKTFVGRAVLGGCSYANTAEFLTCDYYAHMRQTALESLQSGMQACYDQLEELLP